MDNNHIVTGRSAHIRWYGARFSTLFPLPCHSFHRHLRSLRIQQRASYVPIRAPAPPLSVCSPFHVTCRCSPTAIALRFRTSSCLLGMSWAPPRMLEPPRCDHDICIWLRPSAQRTWLYRDPPLPTRWQDLGKALLAAHRDF